MPATNAQVQQFVDQYIRPHSELARQLDLVLDNDRAIIDDVYQNVSNSSTWVDSRTDVPHQITPNDVLAYNAFAEDVRNFIKNHNSYPVIVKCCVRAVQG